MSELVDTSQSTVEHGFYANGEWNEVAPHAHAFNEWINSLDEADMKKYWPKEWAMRFGGMKRGKIYTFNEIKDYKSISFKPGDKVKLIHTRPELFMHVLVESTDRNKSSVGLVHVCCLMLDGGMDNKG